MITKSGQFRTTNFDLSNHFEDDVIIIEKFRVGKIWSAAYYDAEQKYYYLKRFLIEAGTKMTRFIGDHPDSRLIRITEVEYPRLELKFGGKNKDRDSEIIEVAEFIGIKSYKAKGKRLSNYEVKVVEELEPLEVTSGKVAASQQGESQGVTSGKVEEQRVTGGQPEGLSRQPKDLRQQPKNAKNVEKKIEKKVTKAKMTEKEVTEKVGKVPTKKTAAKSESVPEKEEKKTTKKPIKKVVKKDSGKTESKQDPDDVPLEVVKPKEEQKKDNPDDDNAESNGQFSLEW